MAFVVIYDACVLYPAPLRDLLIRLAKSGIVRARWSSQILDECFRSILEQRPDLKPEALSRTRALMAEAVADCMVSGHEKIDAIKRLREATGLDLTEAKTIVDKLAEMKP